MNGGEDGDSLHPVKGSRRSRLISLIALLLFAIFGVLALTQQRSIQFPYVKVEALVADAAGPAALSLTMLLNGQASSERCEKMLADVVNSIVGVCPQCRTVARKCLDKLDDRQSEILSDRPLNLYSARMPNGVTLYESSQADLARLSCQATERHAESAKVSVKCYPPATARPLAGETGHGMFANWRSKQGLFAALALLALFVFVVQVAPSLARDWGGRAGAMPRRSKQTLLMVADLVSLEFALWAAFAIRFESIEIDLTASLPYFSVAPLIALPLFMRFGLYRAIVRYLDFDGLLTIALATGTYIALFGLVIYLWPVPHLPHLPTSVLLIHGILTMMLIGSSRAAARYLIRHADVLRSNLRVHRKRVVVYGAGSAGVQLATALALSREMEPVAMLDDDPVLHGKRIGPLKVYPPAELPLLVERLHVTEVLLAIPSASRSRRNEIMATLESLPVLVRTLPGVAEIAEGLIKTADLREVEIEDLLGRDAVAPIPHLLGANITGKSVMVTGAGGSIGAELCRQILEQRPTELVLYELNEFALYSVERDLQSQPGLLRRGTRIWPVLGSVVEADRMARAIRRFGVQTIYHAAAFKHVPLVESNPCEGVVNNVLGTWHAAHAALDAGVQTFVLISTDKAVRPTNTMGATKRLAEMILQALALEHPTKTRFTMVRFGNVLGSSGSVVPLFREQIKRGGPVTVTDPRVIRYFMTIPEASQLVIQAGAMGEDGDVFVLDMGDPVKILDLARRMVSLSGLSVRDEEHADGDIEIVFTGLRPGEKLYEELLIGDNVSPTSHPRIRKANEKMRPLAQIRGYIDQLRDACAAGDSDAVRELLLSAVEDFAPQCANQDNLAAPAGDVSDRVM